MSLFSKEVKMLQVLQLLKRSIVRYTITIDIDVSFSPLIHHYRSINIVIHRKFDALLQPYRPVLFWIFFNWTLHLDLTYKEMDCIFIWLALKRGRNEWCNNKGGFALYKDISEEPVNSFLLGAALVPMRIMPIVLFIHNFVIVKLSNVAKTKYPPCSCFLSFCCLTLIINTSFPFCTMT